MHTKVRTIFSEYAERGWRFKDVCPGVYGLFAPTGELVYKDYDYMVGAKKLVAVAQEWEKKSKYNYKKSHE